MKSHPVLTPSRLAALALCAGLAGCSSLDGLMSGEKVDYRGTAVQSKPLDVPPDLSQLARDSRYQVQGGVVSASGAAAPASTTAAGAGPAAANVALQSLGGMRVERAGQQRWLVVPMTAEQLWPRLRGFWEQRGFTLELDDAPAGVMETGWAENRAKLPQDLIRKTIGRLVEGLYDTGERDRFHTRVERVDGGVEVYITHRGLTEAYATAQKEDGTQWRRRPSDPQLEAEMLARLMVSLGSQEAPARQALASAPEQPSRARTLAGSAALEVDEPFDRTWRRVGLALDRSGYTVEDRDRTAGVYYVRYVDPKNAGKEEPGFWARLLGDSSTTAPVRYRIAVKAGGDKTTVSVLTSAGAAETGENGKRIAAQLVAELR